MAVERFVVSQDAPGDAGKFVGQRRCELVAMKAWRCLREPGSEAELLPVMRPHQDDVSRLDEQGTEILVAALCDTTKACSSPGAVLTRHQPKPGTEVAASLNRFASADSGHHGG